MTTHPISTIYAAFDPDSHRVYRAAMARSQGGVVRVSDLVAALAELELEQCRELLSDSCIASWRRQPRDGDGTPMSNEPALRDLFQVAHRIAAVQGGDQASVISAKVLWAASIIKHAAHISCSLQQAFTTFGIVCPSEFVDCRVGEVLPVRIWKRSAECTESTDELIEQVLAQWLELQAMPMENDRASVLRTLAMQVRCIEERNV